MTTFEEWLKSSYRPFSGAETPPEGGQAGGQPAAPAEGGEGGSGGQNGGQEGATPEALAPLMERMESMGQQIEQLAQSGSAQAPGAAGVGGAPGEDPSQMPGFLGYDGYGNAMYQPPAGQFDPQGPLAQAMPGPAAVPQVDPQQAQQLAALGLMDPASGEINEPAAQAFMGMAGQMGDMQRQVQGAMQQLGRMRLEMDAGNLESEIPELQDPEKGEAIVDKAIEAAQQMGNPLLAQNPGFIRLIYRAEKAQEAAAGETPLGGQQGTALESAQGAGAPAEPGPDAGDLVVNAGNRGGFWGFGGQQG